MNKGCLVISIMLLSTCVCFSSETNVAKMTGIQLQACATALKEFIGSKDGANLEHYTVEVSQRSDQCEVIFVPNHPESVATVRGGATKYGQEVHYIVSRDRYEIKGRSYGR